MACSFCFWLAYLGISSIVLVSKEWSQGSDLWPEERGDDFESPVERDAAESLTSSPKYVYVVSTLMHFTGLSNITFSVTCRP